MRRSLTPRVRFEVFKRDDFTCRYCGRKTPTVVLEVDHVVPVSEGGDDDSENLVTSCFECNRGKGSVLIDALAPGVDVHEQTILLLEREMQLREYNEIRKQVRARESAQIEELIDYWVGIAPRQGSIQNPHEDVLRHYLRLFPATEIQDAMDIAMRQRGAWTGCKYLAGILRNWARDRGLEAEREE